jgi:hypothetical protein
MPPLRYSVIHKEEKMKTKRLTVLFLAAVLLSLAPFSCFKSMSSEELKASMEITDIDTYWTDKYYQPWPPRLILVPVLAFRVKNLTSEPMTYVNFNAIFKFKEEAENLGDCFLAAIRNKAVPPGEKSDVIVLKSNFGVEGKSLDSFKDNPRWRIVSVKLFARARGSQYVALGEWDVSRRIDFKEPEPVHMGDKGELKKEKK